MITIQIDCQGLNTFFKNIDKVRQYATRLASRKSHYLLKARTNYRKFNIHSSEAKLLNATKKDLQSASP